MDEDVAVNKKTSPPLFQKMKKNRKAWLSIIESALLVGGLTLLGIYVGARIHSTITFHQAVRVLKDTRAPESSSGVEPPSLPADSPMPIDTTLWSSQRLRAYERSLVNAAGTPLALMRIPKLSLEVPVLEGTDPITLNSGAGRIPGTAFPGQAGNIGIAGHRDGFFRALKDIQPGDVIQLITPQRTVTYTVETIQITVPTDVTVLRQDTRSELTLVTCYPFYYIGPAPKRYIVRASVKD